MKYLDGNYYHIYNRGAHKEKIFFESANYLHLISLFKKYSSQYNVIVVSYCLMPNHYHLILRQKTSGGIGDFLRTTFNAYTQAINKRYNHSGTLFQGQSKSKHLKNNEHCLQAIRYIHCNPVAAHLASSLTEWQFSNFLEWIGLRRGTLADFDLRDKFFKTPRDYEKFAEEYIEKEKTRGEDLYLAE